MFKKKNKEEEVKLHIEEPAEISAEETAQPQPEDELYINAPAEKKKRFQVKGKKKIVLVLGLIVVLAVIAGLLFGGKGGSTGIPVTTSTVERTAISQTIDVKGTVQGSDSANIYSAMDYRIKSVNVEEGDTVTEGQILASLDADDLKDQYSKASISYQESKRKYEATKALYEEGAVSKDDYLSAKADFESSSLTLNSLNLNENSNVISPISGTVTRVNATVGKLANGGSNTGEPLFVIENLDNLQMKVSISEYDISDIKEGQTVTISAEVLGKETVSGVVSRIAPTGEQKADGTEMVIPVVIDVDKGESNLIAGVTAKATILIASREDVLTVPIDAIIEDPSTGTSFIFLVSDSGILSQKEVTVGLESDFYVEISGEGIDPGALVLLAPTFEHYDGMQVSLMPTAPAN